MRRDHWKSRNDALDPATDYEVGNPQAVFDGDIDGFLEAGIRWRMGAEKAAAN